MKFSVEKNEFEANYNDLSKEEIELIEHGSFEDIVNTWNKVDKRIRELV